MTLRVNLSRHMCRNPSSIGGTGPHAFAVRIRNRSSADPNASIASRTNVRDDREAPLSVGRDARKNH